MTTKNNRFPGVGYVHTNAAGLSVLKDVLFQLNDFFFIKDKRSEKPDDYTYRPQLHFCLISIENENVSLLSETSHSFKFLIKLPTNEMTKKDFSYRHCPVSGTCVCGTCSCNPGYTGEECGCTINTDTCMSSDGVRFCNTI